MKNYRELIETEAKTINKLYQNIKTTVKNRSKDRVSWQQACHNYHNYQSKIDFHIEQVYTTKNFADKNFKNINLINFIISYLEVDPWYHRSGYIKQDMIRKIKRMKFTTQQLRRLKIILKDAVEKRPFREFKSYCSLAQRIADKELIDHLKSLIIQTKSSKRSRANLMLSYCK